MEQIKIQHDSQTAQKQVNKQTKKKKKKRGEGKKEKQMMIV